MSVKLEKIETTTLYNVEFENKSYKLVQIENNITGLCDYELYLDGVEQAEELLDKILMPDIY